MGQAEILEQAEGLLRRGKYAEVIRLLESSVVYFREEERFFLMLSYAYFKLSDRGEAAAFLDRGLKQNPESPALLQFRAVLELFRSKPKEAVRIWLDLLDRDPANAQALEGLKRVKRVQGDARLKALLKSRWLRRQLPKFPRKISFSFGFFSAFLLGVFLLISTGALVYRKFFFKTGPETKILQEERTGSASGKIDSERRAVADQIFEDEGSGNGVLESKEFPPDLMYRLSSKEIGKSLKRIRTLFEENRDNEIRVEMNRLRYSNAAEAVKKKIQALRAFLLEPELDTLKENFPVEAVLKDPLLYEGVFVRWTGKMADYRLVNDRFILFNLLVTESEKEILEGVVPVKVPFLVKENTLAPLEVFGRIRRGDDGRPLLEARTLHTLYGASDTDRKKKSGA